MKIVGFAGSSSKNSINKELVKYVVEQIKDAEIEVLDLNDYELPIYSIDRQTENGFPELAEAFLKKIQEADGLIISLAEHNGNLSTALKNILDWVSRIKMTYLEDKKVLLMATSPGGFGGKTVLEIGAITFGYAKAEVIEKFSLPSFYDNFKEGKMVHEDFQEELNNKIAYFQEALSLVEAK